MGSYKNVLYEKKGRIVYVTLNRPEKLNAWNDGQADDHRAALEEADADPDVSVVVVKGAGRAFSAGHDISPERQAARQAKIEADRAAGKRPLSRLYQGVRGMTRGIVRRYQVAWEIDIPVIGQIHGYCLSGAWDALMYYDVLVASDDCIIGHPALRIMGLPDNPMWGYILGPRRAKLMLLTGNAISGKQAADWGMVSKSVPADRLEDEVIALAEHMAKIPRELLVMEKMLVNQWADNSGLSAMQRFNGILAGLGSMWAEEQTQEWSRMVRERGVKAALNWRDGQFSDSRFQIGDLDQNYRVALPQKRITVT